MEAIPTVPMTSDTEVVVDERTAVKKAILFLFVNWHPFLLGLFSSCAKSNLDYCIQAWSSYLKREFNYLKEVHS